MLIPYVMNNGAWSLNDEVIRGIWEQMVEHRLDKMVFPSNEIKNSDVFLKYMKIPRNIVHTIWDVKRISMIAWLNEFGSNCAFAHFCCFPHTFGTTSVDLGRQSLGHWFDFKKDDGFPLLNVILGRIPTLNERAINYAQKCGMTEAGTVPGILYGDKIYDTSFLYITREDFNNGR